MGEKYDAYAMAAQAEQAAADRAAAEAIGGDAEAYRQAQADADQANRIANVLYNEWSGDVQG